ncbi:MAG TPA: 30S ribosomal protein S17 [Gammaproteobacteria bacterium]|nr:30S ribosomal protein S17 [Gammaproteobacteria bacterium]
MGNKNSKQSVVDAGTKIAGATRALTATVISNKMDKTIVVQVLRMVKHPVYGKYQRHYSKMYVHDINNQSKEGDVVRIKQTRPLSKLKSWTLVEIIRRADTGLEVSETELADTENLT